MTKFNIVALESDDWKIAQKHGVDREKLTETIASAARDVAKILPLAHYVNVIVRPTESSDIPETGDGAFTYDTEFLIYTFNRDIPTGATELLRSARGTIFHELNHTARWLAFSNVDTRVWAFAIAEGLATVFARDYANSREGKLWGNYQAESDETLRGWLREIKQLPNGDFSDDYRFFHPDGRRWILYKVGTWLVDRAADNSRKSVTELTVLPADEILKLAKVEENHV